MMVPFLVNMLVGFKSKMLDAIFEILRTGMSMESTTASYQLLCELEMVLDFLCSPTVNLFG